MSATVESKSLEADIADCCQAIYAASDPETVMRNWSRLSALKARRAEEQNLEFLRDSHGANHSMDGASPAAR